MKDTDWRLESETDLHPDVPGELSAGPETPHLEIFNLDLPVAEAALPLTDLSWIARHQLLETPANLPAGHPRLRLALALHHVHLPRGEDRSRGRGVTDLVGEASASLVVHVDPSHHQGSQVQGQVGANSDRELSLLPTATWALGTLTERLTSRC